MAISDDIRVKPSVFAKEVLGITPYPFQVDFLDDSSKRIVFKSGRQVGKTMCTAVKALHYAIFHPNSVTLVLAYSERQAGILFGRVKQLLDVMNKSKYRVGVKRETLRMLELKNMSEIHTVPAGEDGSGARGYTAEIVILDEASRMNDPIFEAVQPCLAATDGTLILLSTPWGKRGFFYESFEDEAFSTYDIPSRENTLITEEFLEDMKRRLTRTAYNQEYLGEFVSEVDRLFSDELIESCINPDLPIMEFPPNDGANHVFRLGVDPARFGEDETAYIGLDISVEPYRVVFVDLDPGRKTTHTAGRIKDLHLYWRYTTVFIDETALGGGIVDQLGGVPYQAINFSGKKGNMFQNLKILMEQGLLQFPDIPKLKKQLQGMTYEYRESGKMKISGDSRWHDDLPCALVLAVFGLTKPPGVMRFISG